MGGLAALLVSSLVYIHIQNLESEITDWQNKYVKVETVAQEQSETLEKLLKKQAQEQRIQERNRKVQGEIIKARDEEILTLKKAINDEKEYCLSEYIIPDHIINRVYPETINKDRD